MLNLSNAGVALSYTYGRVLDGARQGESPAPVTSPISKRLFIGPFGHYALLKWGK